MGQIFYMHHAESKTFIELGKVTARNGELQFARNSDLINQFLMHCSGGRDGAEFTILDDVNHEFMPFHDEDDCSKLAPGWTEFEPIRAGDGGAT